MSAQQLKEVLHSRNVSFISRFASDVPIVLISVQEKGENLMGKIGAVGQMIQSLPSKAANEFFCVPCCVGSCTRTKSLNSRALVGPYSPIRLSPFSRIQVSTILTSNWR
ncbi:hypothetical protein AVEN_375-1 [Araneus ventricosus]|uniref:Uncharacterized protein n=1 Tax=Araneus ventricosus TaxID=182803 RepID=A0A4Y2DVC6_ARAVE|nr:hypothetical protein AVEN_375-1 [Araneus ventricosus]